MLWRERALGLLWRNRALLLWPERLRLLAELPGATLERTLGGLDGLRDVLGKTLGCADRRRDVLRDSLGLPHSLGRGHRLGSTSLDLYL